MQRYYTPLCNGMFAPLFSDMYPTMLNSIWTIYHRAAACACHCLWHVYLLNTPLFSYMDSPLFSGLYIPLSAICTDYCSEVCTPIGSGMFTPLFSDIYTPHPAALCWHRCSACCEGYTNVQQHVLLHTYTLLFIGMNRHTYCTCRPEPCVIHRWPQLWPEHRSQSFNSNFSFSI